MDNQTWGFIGCGNLAQALIRGATSSGFDKNKIIVLDSNPSKSKKFAEDTGVNVARDLNTLISRAEYVVLAMKPQDLPEALKALNGHHPSRHPERSEGSPETEMKLSHLRANQTVISLVAGIPSDKIKKALGGNVRIVRVMANLPAQIGHGLFGIFYGSVTPEKKQIIESFFNSVGFVMPVKNDAAIDAITSGSASGIGFVFFFMETFQSWFRKKGFSESEAREITVHTFLGASLFAERSASKLSLLREAVTSRKGTTEAGLKAFKKKALAAGLTSGLNAAIAKSRELAKTFKLK